MKAWWKRFDCWVHFKDYSDDPPPRISFSLDAYTIDTYPYARFSSNDTNRWTSLVISLKISRIWMYIHIPYKTLPDYIRKEKKR